MVQSHLGAYYGDIMTNYYELVKENKMLKEKVKELVGFILSNKTKLNLTEEQIKVLKSK